jgi:putative transferase (TIGR04331 family)
MNFTTTAPNQDIIDVPPHVVRIESLVLAVVCTHLQDRHPTLSRQHIEFLSAPWVHFFTHSALHRFELQAGQSITAFAETSNHVDDQLHAVPGDTLAFMEYFRTPAYCSYLDLTLRGQTIPVDCRTAIHILDENLPAFCRTVAFMSCFPRNFRYLLQLVSLGYVRFLKNKPNCVEFATDWDERRQLACKVHAMLAADFPDIANWYAARLQALFPKSLLEYLSFNLNKKRTNHARRTLFSADGWQIIDDWKIYAVVQKVDHNCKWIGAPNAISHGCLAVFWQREFELSHLDRYLTWGWCRNSLSHVIPFYSPHFAGKRQSKVVNNSATSGILISSAARPRHLLEYPYTPERFGDYLKSQLVLAAQVHQLTNEQVAIRTRPKDLGWNLAEMIQSLNNPNVHLEFQDGKFAARLKLCRLHLCDNCSTTIAESLIANHPTLILISGEYFQMSPLADEETSVLMSAGIFHKNVSSLIDQLSKINADIFGWWSSDSTQKAVQIFLTFQAKNQSSIFEWKHALMHTSKNI